ncbi:hypothetical protein CC1G_10242 [Coprinopsis cinerea okayama7|uniref:Uncharacterized protein n=1 Tax=Coprinopsis cinerea (strain Okayama-7 / 130 / ATCC MYA-4618 / FGSC 9003) TaxID=240176 RepID=A8NPD9_COPC7|nr:hypothetical protein CC1G_10242 [Coprinopsis cinerea okayama7\|eukprot:XP_001835315.2 hypothetical protein CC1G_10242 [Coprinopsis cinerea okayama7\
MAALRYFNTSGEPLLTPYAYFAVGQKLPEKLQDNGLMSGQMVPSDYALVGDIKDIIPLGHISPEAATAEGVDPVDAERPVYLTVCGAVDHVEILPDRLKFKLLMDPYMAPLGTTSPIGVSCTITIEGSPRWSFLSDNRKRRNFVRKGSYVSVEGRHTGTDIITEGDGERSVTLCLQVEDVTLLGKAPTPSEDVIEIVDSPLTTQGGANPATPVKSSYKALLMSGALSSAKKIGKRKADSDEGINGTPTPGPSKIART